MYLTTHRLFGSIGYHRAKESASQMTKILTSLLFTALIASANPVTVQLIGTSGVSDGSDYVLPYFISIDGGPSIAVACYDFFDTVTVGQTWLANELTLAQAATTGQFSGNPNALQGYETIAVLDAFTFNTAQQETDLQHTIWDVFDPGAFSVDSAMALDLTEATGEIPTFNFSGTTFLEGVGNTSQASGNEISNAQAQARVQAFVFGGTPLRVDNSPEPGTWFLLVAGILALLVVRKGLLS